MGIAMLNPSYAPPFDKLRANGLSNLPPLNADFRHLAVADRLQFGDADLDPWSVEVLDELYDTSGHGFQQCSWLFPRVVWYCFFLLYSLQKCVHDIFDLIAGH